MQPTSIELLQSDLVSDELERSNAGASGIGQGHQTIAQAGASVVPDAANAAVQLATPKPWRDIVTLTKPRITTTVVLTMWGAMHLAADLHGISSSWSQVALALVGTSLVVGGANAFNMYLERESDAFMPRTARRPLPAGRLNPKVALGVGIGLGLAGVPTLVFGLNLATGMLALLAYLSYVFVYTPLKRKTTASLPIGAIPGAIPPLLGWTAATGRIEVPGLLLFALMFCWQIPHFLAIATFRRFDYARAGLKVLPMEKGQRLTRHHIVRWSSALLLVSLLLVSYDVGGWAYPAVALVGGLLFFGFSVAGLRQGAGDKWAKQLFALSLLYIVAIFAALFF